MKTTHRPSARLLWAALAAVLALFLATPAGAATEQAVANELTAAKAVVLGLVEGVTEYLPVSSTGHLLVAERLMDVGETTETKDAADTYVIVIQLGAILAVLLLYWSRIVELFRGLIGRSESGRRLLYALVIAFVPAALMGVAFDDKIKEVLLEPGPIAAAWIVGAGVILLVAPRLQAKAIGGRALELIEPRHAVLIGVAQVAALWPGMSRSLVTIMGALAVGMAMSAAVEFSFLLGLMTLGAATIYDGAKHGGEVIDTFGIAMPMLGFAVAFVSAFVAVKWLVRYLERHGLAIFGWYRLAAAGVLIALMATSTI